MGVQGRRSREKGGGGQEMSSTLSYYASKNRASERLDNKRNEISRSSAYILDSTSSTNRSSYSSNTPQSYADSRTGRSSYRDRSTDFSARTSHGHRSSSRDIGSVRLRNREHSTDISHRKDFSQSYSNGSTSAYTSSRASKYESEDRSEEYKKIMSSTDKYVTMAKYTTADHSDTTNMLEEERRSKAYSKIIGSAQSTEADNSRATLTDIFCNTNGFSVKTVQAIYKETLYKEEGGRPKNYGWRKDMEAYEDNLDKINEHKKAVRETTKATRDVNYKDTNAKIRDYERESRRNVDYESPVIKKTADIVKPSSTSTYSTTSNVTPASNYYRSSAAIEDYEPESKPVRGSWRKDLETFEHNLDKKKTAKPTPAVAPSYSTNASSVPKLETETSSTSWRDEFKKFGDNTTSSSTAPASATTKKEDNKPLTITSSAPQVTVKTAANTV